jgi:hypothetical protein
VTSRELDLFLLGGIALCLLMILVTLFRVRSRGKTALLLTGAFAAMAALLYALLVGASFEAVVVIAIVLVLFLAADFVARSAQAGSR